MCCAWNLSGELHWSLYRYNTRCACPELRIILLILLSELLCRCLLSCVIMSITFVASTLATPVLDTLVSYWSQMGTVLLCTGGTLVPANGLILYRLENT